MKTELQTYNNPYIIASFLNFCRWRRIRTCTAYIITLRFLRLTPLQMRLLASGVIGSLDLVLRS